MSKSRQGLRIALIAVTLSIFTGGLTFADDLLFDWKATQAPTPVTGYIPAPFVDNSTNGATLGPKLAPVPYSTIKITQPLSAGQISSIFGNAGYQVNYAFFDLEGASAAQFAGQVSAVNAAAAAASKPKPFTGNFDVYTVTGDTTRAPGYTGGGYSAYLATGANVASEALYPGSFTYRTKTTNPATDQAPGAPNIRSALFTLPITRMTMVEATLPLGNKHIPFVNRFNNFGNALLNDTPTAQFPFKWSNPTGDQMLSRADFKAMVAHYRLRGVDGIHLLDGGVVNYSQTDFEQDAKDGWNIPKINEIFNGGNAKLATLDTTVRISGNTMSLENAGLAFSGVYSLTQNAGRGKLAILASNLAGTARDLSFPNKIGAKAILGSFNIPAGKHELLEFTGAGTQWQLVSTTPLFDSLGAETDRSGVGVPEPMVLGSLSLFGLLMFSRRSRKN